MKDRSRVICNARKLPLSFDGYSPFLFLWWKAELAPKGSKSRRSRLSLRQPFLLCKGKSSLSKNNIIKTTEIIPKVVYQMENWLELSETEYEQVWDHIYDQLKFKPSMSKFPSFKVPTPFITYDISLYFGESEDMDAYEDLEEKALLVFQEINSKDEYIYALDWQHDGYWINPHLEFPKNEFNEWMVPIFPNGDYYFFVHKEFKWGYLGHPWERSITLFGEQLIKGFEKHKPRMFRKILRYG